MVLGVVLAVIAERLRDHGITALLEEDLVQMANLHHKESKKANYELSSADYSVVVTAFATHVAARFGANSLVVDDLRPLLLKNASILETSNRKSLPVSALILYAT